MHVLHYKQIYENQETLWWYKGMRYISALLLQKYLTKKKNVSILDAGCGAGAALTFLSSYGNVIGVDISSDALGYARKFGKVVKADISSLPFKENSFDLVYSFGVLYHRWVKNDVKVLKEYYRVLKPGGILLLEEPALNWLSGNEDAIAFGKHRYYRHEIDARVKRASFQILKLTYANVLFLPLAILRRLPQVLKLSASKEESDILHYPHLFNIIAAWILYAESYFLKYMDFPIGMDVFCVAKKTNGND